MAQPRTPVSEITSDARNMARLECRYGDMTQSRLTCPVIRSGERATCGTARLGRERTTYRLICAHDSDAAYSHFTRRTRTSLCQARGGLLLRRGLWPVLAGVKLVPARARVAVSGGAAA